MKTKSDFIFRKAKGSQYIKNTLKKAKGLKYILKSAAFPHYSQLEIHVLASKYVM